MWCVASSPRSTAASTKRWPTMPLPMTRMVRSDTFEPPLAVAPVDDPRDAEAHEVEGDERGVGAVARLGVEERLAERQVHEHTAEGTDGAGDADQRAGQAPSRSGFRFKVGARVHRDIASGLGREDRWDHLVRGAVAEAAEDEECDGA